MSNEKRAWSDYPDQTKKAVNATYRNVSKQLRNEAFSRLRAKAGKCFKTIGPMKEFFDATKEQQLTINLWQTRLRESALSFALLPPEKRDPTDLYLMARAFDTVVRDAGLDHLWRMPDHVMSPNTACASSSD